MHRQTFKLRYYVLRYMLCIETSDLTCLAVAAVESGRTRTPAGDASSWIAVSSGARYCQTNMYQTVLQIMTVNRLFSNSWYRQET